MMMVIGVIGGGSCSEEEGRTAERVGELIARRGAALVCGGLFGVMEAACRGAKKIHGVTIGVLPGADRATANRYVTLPVVTDMGHARNVIIVQTAQALIAIGGEGGTMSEIALGLKTGKTVVSIGPRPGIEGVVIASTPEEAVDLVFDELTAG